MGKRLRERLERPGIIVAPGVFDALSARICEIAGFEVLQHTGYGTAASLLAKPDVGLLSFGEMRDQLYRMVHAVDIPVIGDGDNGFGNAVNVDRTVREYIWAGAAGLFVEDQVIPKRCGHMSGKAVILEDEMMGKLRAAMSARDQEDRSTLIVYRTDAVAVNGLEDALSRAKRAADLGVDMVFVEALESLDQMERAVEEVPVPLMLNLVEGGRTPLVSPSMAEQMGFKYLMYPVTPLFAGAKAMLDVMSDVRKNGLSDSKVSLSMDFAEFADVVRLDRIREIEDDFLPEESLNRYGDNRGIL
ncbi:isocitrate lyase/PEP mutase family protein [Dethiosulfovibrio sp. F2B]|uniref:isocitrate lyase/PEP mutase family protein n=1 Tax=Dethiosulfovibrio faecalis TaxID=2720018 RepID=UPI001F254141|nr:isocitrate lyase/PEP mutase family protein [Dethiosulfovibrio faecalis]MCF4151411.1 isocitrate lyase/PEP mutase family protein [Dethiosulfovibrio faecalis]